MTVVTDRVKETCKFTLNVMYNTTSLFLDQDLLYKICMEVFFNETCKILLLSIVLQLCRVILDMSSTLLDLFSTDHQLNVKVLTWLRIDDPHEIRVKMYEITEVYDQDLFSRDRWMVRRSTIL